MRPVYFWVYSDFIIFASALRILESLHFYRKEIDLKGITEIACFGYPLSDRTPYKDIFSLYAGEIVCFDTDKIERKNIGIGINYPQKEQKIYILLNNFIQLSSSRLKFD